MSFLVAALVAFVAVGVAMGLLPRIWPGFPSVAPALLALFAAVIALVVLSPWQKARMVKRFDELSPPTLTRLAADDTGMTVTDGLSQAFWDWRHVHGAIATPDGVALLISYGGIVIPAAAFKDPAEQLSFIALVSQRATPA